MMMNSGSFEGLKSYLFVLNLENSIAALLRYVIFAQTIPIYYHKMGFIDSLTHKTVGSLSNLFTFSGFTNFLIK